MLMNMQSNMDRMHLCLFMMCYNSWIAIIGMVVSIDIHYSWVHNNIKNRRILCYINQVVNNIISVINKN